MMRWLILLAVAAGICFPLLLRVADEKKVTLVDYFLLLPLDYFGGPPANCVDLANGYMSFIGDGAQPEFEVAFFAIVMRPRSWRCLGTWKDKTLCPWIVLRWVPLEK